MLFTDSITYDLVGILIALVVVVIAYFKWAFTYWKKRGLETPETITPFGNVLNFVLFRKSFGEVWRDIYFDIKSKGLRHGGAYSFSKPVYVPTDIEIIKSILQSDYQNFSSHGMYVNEKLDPVSVNLFNLDGTKWKTLRSKLSPSFSSGKIKAMYQTILDCSQGLKELLDESSKTTEPLDIKEIMARFTTDIIGSCAFGLDCSCMKNPESDFRKYGERAVNLDLIGTLRAMGQLMVPHSILSIFNYRGTEKEVCDFFVNLVKSTIGYREKNRVVRKDFLDLLIQLKYKGTDDTKVMDGTLNLNEIAAQSFFFFLAGYETSSTVLNFGAYELALHPEIQDKLREEMNDVLQKHGNVITYEAVMEMSYLDKVICETLRKYPPIPEVTRICTETYRVPGADVVIEKGVTSEVSILGIHYDPDYYPDPDLFDPERFSEENKASRPPFAWLPFGEGPRICLGLRFGMLQLKLGLIALINNFKISLNQRTPSPLRFKKRGVILSFEHKVWIDIQKLD